MIKAKVKVLKYLNISFLPSYCTKFCKNIFLYKNYTSDYSLFTLEKRKIKVCYNLKTNLLKKYLICVNLNKPYLVLNILINLKIDTILTTIGLTKTILESKQLIIHKHILLNYKMISNFNLILNKGSIISLNPISKNIIKILKKNLYLKLNSKSTNIEYLKNFKICLNTLSCLILNTNLFGNILTKFKIELF